MKKLIHADYKTSYSERPTPLSRALRKNILRQEIEEQLSVIAHSVKHTFWREKCPKHEQVNQANNFDQSLLQPWD